MHHAIGNGRQPAHMRHVSIKRLDLHVQTVCTFDSLAAFKLLLHRHTLAVTLCG